MPARTQAQALDVRIAGQEALMPKWVHLRSSVAGICPDILMAIERVEPRLRFSGYRQSRSLPGIEMGLENGSLDAACALAPSARRQGIGQAAGPALYQVRHRLVARAGDDADIHSVQDLLRLDPLVIAQRGAVFTDELRAAGLAQRVRIQPGVLKEEPTYFWVSRKAGPAIGRLIGAALEKLRASGELGRIYATHTADL